jgi:hypothetical protein
VFAPICHVFITLIVTHRVRKRLIFDVHCGDKLFSCGSYFLVTTVMSVLKPVVSYFTLSGFRVTNAVTGVFMFLVPREINTSLAHKQSKKSKNLVLNVSICPYL